MMLFIYINTNIERVKKDIKLGLMPCSILHHWEIYARYDALKKMGNNTTMSVFQVSELYEISEPSIYRIIRKMESDVCVNN
jgi:hypothetical protein